MSEFSALQCNPVLEKMPCLFEISVADHSSTKRHGQSYAVVATEEFSQVGRALLSQGVIPTEKVDGTCCRIQDGGLWKRYDRKLTNHGSANLENFRKAMGEWKQKDPSSYVDRPKIQWDLIADWKEPPSGWVTLIQEPGEESHWIGWLPVDLGSKEDKWHASALCNDAQKCRLIVQDDTGKFKVREVPLIELEGKTAELIGPKVQGNIYQTPLIPGEVLTHYLVIHGSLRFSDPPPTTSMQDLKNWFENSPEGNVEGVVWHSCGHSSVCSSSCSQTDYKDKVIAMVKIHRHHLGLPWPLAGNKTPRLSISLNN